MVTMIRSQIGPLACCKKRAFVKGIPKTRSVNILGGGMRAIADSKEYCMTATIDDQIVLEKISEDLDKRGYPKPAEPHSID